MRLSRRVDPDSAAAIIIDVQNDFCHPEGVVGSNLKDEEKMVNRFTDNLNNFINTARKYNIPLIFVRGAFRDYETSEEWVGRFGVEMDSEEYDPSLNPAAEPEGWGFEFYKIKPENGDIHITKNRYSAFTGTNLNLILQSIKRRSLLVMGATTNICVESTIRDAVDNDYFITLVEDCCIALTENEHHSTITNVKQLFGSVSNTEEIFTIWEKKFSVKA